jgi:hypothetical protein
VFGTRSTPQIEQALSEYGFDEFEAEPEGFRAVRPLPDETEHELD